MELKQAFLQLLQLNDDWEVVGFVIDDDNNQVTINVKFKSKDLISKYKNDLGELPAWYDTKPREWRHLDLFQYKTIIKADIPRVTYPSNDKPKQIEVP